MVIFSFILGLILITTAVAVVALKNPIHSALALITNLLTVAAFFAVLNAHFLAVAQIIVYAGAIMVLFVFVLMLLNIKSEANPNGKLASALAVCAGVFFTAVLVKDIKNSAAPFFSKGVNGSVEAVGKLLYTDFVFAFELASLLIIAAILGAVMLAKRKGSFPVLNSDSNNSENV